MPVQYEYTMKLGASRLTIKTDSNERLFKEVGFFGSLPDTCPRCGSPVRLNHRSYEKFDYYELVCDGSQNQSGESHKAKIGQHLEKDEGMFYKENQNWLTFAELKDGKKNYDDGSEGGNSGAPDHSQQYDDMYGPPFQNQRQNQRQRQPQGQQRQQNQNRNPLDNDLPY